MQLHINKINISISVGTMSLTACRTFLDLSTEEHSEHSEHQHIFYRLRALWCQGGGGRGRGEEKEGEERGGVEEE